MKVPVHNPPPHNAPPSAPSRPRSEASSTPVASPRSAPGTARPQAERQADRSDSSLFQSLMGQTGMENQPVASVVPLLLASQLPDLQEPVTETQTAATPPVWRLAEPQLAQSVMNAGPLPATMTLMLPQLGPVEATLDALTGGGWDIALAFTPQAWPLVKGAQLLCGRSLEQRLGKPVLLRFMQQAFT